jgi:pimeloyl-ACP methyl ester carboxylesterase
MPELVTDDVTLFVEVDGDGPPVTVVAHGLTNNRLELAAVTPFVPGMKVRFDFRGHGRSSAPQTGYAFADFARDVEAVADAYGATCAVGSSLGAGALASLVCRRPDRFERMVWLLPAALDLTFPYKDRYRALAATLEGRSAEEALDRVLSDPERAAQYVRTPWKLEIDRALWDHENPDGVARAVRGAIEDWPVKDRSLLARVEAPVLLICIEGDEIHPAELGRIYLDLLPNADLIVLSGQDELYASIPTLIDHVSRFLLGEG